MALYHRCVELINAFPLFVSGFHDINLVIVKISLCFDVLDYDFCGIA